RPLEALGGVRGKDTSRCHCLQHPTPTLVVAPPPRPPPPPSGSPMTVRPRVSRAAVMALTVRFMVSPQLGGTASAVMPTMTGRAARDVRKASESVTLSGAPIRPIGRNLG